MIINTICGKYDVTASEIKAISSKIDNVIIHKKEKFILELNEKLTPQEQKNLDNTFNSKRITTKSEYSKAKTTAEKLDFIAKNLNFL